MGASPNPERYAYKAIHRLLAAKHPVFAFGVKKGEVGGQEITNKIEDLKTPDLDTITLYLSAANQVPYYKDILSMKPKRVIFNPGTENPELEEKLQAAGIESLEACTLVLLATGQY